MAKKFNNNKRFGSKNGRRKNGNKSGWDKDPRKGSPTNTDSTPDMGSEEVAQKGRNHIEWYVADANLLKDVASIPFNYRTGDVLRVYNSDSYVLPGIASIQYVPTLGEANDPHDALNTASTAVYSWIRHANSGSRNYDANDLMLYLMAMDSIYTGIFYCMRALNTSMVYARENKYLPQYLLNAQGVAWNNVFYGDIPNHRARLNQIILKAATLAVPDTFPLYDRHTWMVSNIFTDEPNQWAQLYLFAPTYLWEFAIDDTTGLGKLTPTAWVPRDGGTQTMKWYLDKLDNMLNALYGDEDAGIMSGDILKAYGNDKLMKLDTLAAAASAVPVYNHDVLNQIHNATILGTVEPEDITQVIVDTGDGTAGYLTSELWVENTSPAIDNIINGKKLLDIHGDISPEQVMRCTRFMVPTIEREGDSNNFLIHDYPTEVVDNIMIWKLNSDNSISKIMIDGPVPYSVANMQNFAYASQISYMPTIIGYDISDALNGSKYAIFSNTDRSTTISNDNIKQLNEAALLGLYNVPRLTLQS